MKVKWLGHASFLITSDKGVKIITDPYKTGPTLKYTEVKGPADVVTVSHEHYDHNCTSPIEGNPRIIRGTNPAEVKGIKFRGVATFHDENKGKDRGTNTIFCFEVDGVRICHLGDLGHKLSDQEIAQIGKVDVLLTPMAGFYTIDAEVATEVSAKLKPKVIIPMHFKNERCDFPVATVDDFLKGKKNVTRVNSSEIELKAGKIPAETTIIVLKPAL
ncbi:MAG: MBL fold metallo-hydrolase [Dehalococcoidales bacterium]|nr:MBL fold metallo-hydrolase [Dehalococcoidales bacterium]